jgi:UDP-glucose 6-dehydrogenase
MNTDITFICVGTPSQKNGGIDLTFIKQATQQSDHTEKTSISPLRH